MPEMMKIINERQTQKQQQQQTNKQRNKDKKEQGDKSYSEMVKVKWFCCAFKLGFLLLICKASFSRWSVDV